MIKCLTYIREGSSDDVDFDGRLWRSWPFWGWKALLSWAISAQQLSIAIVLSQNFFLWFTIILVNGPPLWHFRAQYFIDSFFLAGHPPNLSTVVTAASISKYIVVVAGRAAVYSSYFKAVLLLARHSRQVLFLPTFSTAQPPQ